VDVPVVGIAGAVLLGLDELTTVMEVTVLLEAAGWGTLVADESAALATDGVAGGGALSVGMFVGFVTIEETVADGCALLPTLATDVVDACATDEAAAVALDWVGATEDDDGSGDTVTVDEVDGCSWADRKRGTTTLDASGGCGETPLGFGVDGATLVVCWKQRGEQRFEQSYDVIHGHKQKKGFWKFERKQTFGPPTCWKAQGSR
jgi:hypothetical protein